MIMGNALLEEFDILLAEMIMLFDILLLLVFTEKFFEKRSDRIKEMLRRRWGNKEEEEREKGK